MYSEGQLLSVTFFQGTDVTVGDGFAPLGPPLLPWENRMGRVHIQIYIHRHRDYYTESAQWADSVKINKYIHRHFDY